MSAKNDDGKGGTTKPKRRSLLLAPRIKASDRQPPSGSQCNQRNDRDTVQLGDDVASAKFQLGDIVSIAGAKTGILRYVGLTKFASGTWCGIELSCLEGKHSGVVKGVCYFVCPPNRGIFAPSHRVALVSKACCAEACSSNEERPVSSKVSCLAKGRKSESKLARPSLPEGAPKLKKDGPARGKAGGRRSLRIKQEAVKGAAKHRDSDTKTNDLTVNLPSRCCDDNKERSLCIDLHKALTFAYDIESSSPESEPTTQQLNDTFKVVPTVTTRRHGLPRSQSLIPAEVGLACARREELQRSLSQCAVGSCIPDGSLWRDLVDPHTPSQLSNSSSLGLLSDTQLGSVSFSLDGAGDVVRPGDAGDAYHPFDATQPIYELDWDMSDILSPERLRSRSLTPVVDDDVTTLTPVLPLPLQAGGGQTSTPVSPTKTTDDVATAGDDHDLVIASHDICDVNTSCGDCQHTSKTSDSRLSTMDTDTVQSVTTGTDHVLVMVPECTVLTTDLPPGGTSPSAVVSTPVTVCDGEHRTMNIDDQLLVDLSQGHHKRERPVSVLSTCSADTGVEVDTASDRQRPVSIISMSSIDTGYQMETDCDTVTDTVTSSWSCDEVPSVLSHSPGSAIVQQIPILDVTYTEEQCLRKTDEDTKEVEDNDITDTSAISHCGATCELSTTETIPSVCPPESCTDMNGVNTPTDEASMQAGHAMNGDSCTATQTSERGAEVLAEVESVDGKTEGATAGERGAEVLAEVESVDGKTEGATAGERGAEVLAEVESVTREGAAMASERDTEVLAELEAVDSMTEGATASERGAEVLAEVESVMTEGATASERGTEVLAEVESVNGKTEGATASEHGTEVLAEVESVNGMREGATASERGREVLAEVESVDGKTEGATASEHGTEVLAEVESVTREGATTVGDLQSAERGSCKIHQSTPITDSLSMSLTLSAISLATDSNTSCLDPNTDESTRSEPVLKLTENLPKIPVSRANRRRTDGQGDVKGNGLVARKSKSKLLPVPGVVERKRTRLGAEKPTSSGKKGEIAVGGGTAALRYKPPSLLHKRDTPVLKMTSGTASQSVLKMTSGAASQSVLKMTSGTASQSVLKMTSGAASQSVLKMTRGAASSPETKNSKNRLNERRAIVAVKNTLANSSLKSNKRPSAIGVPKLNLTHSSNKIAPPTIQNGADGNTSVCKLKQTQKSKACPVKADVTLPGSATHHVRRMLSTSTTVQAPSGVTVRNRLSAQGRLITAISRKSSSPEPTSRSSCGSVNSIKSISGDDGQARPAGGKALKKKRIVGSGSLRKPASLGDSTDSVQFKTPLNQKRCSTNGVPKSSAIAHSLNAFSSPQVTARLEQTEGQLNQVRQHTEQLMVQRDALISEIQCIKQQYSDAEEQLRFTHQVELNQVEQQHVDKVASLRTSYEQEHSRTQQEHARTQQEHSRTLTDLHHEHSIKLENITERFQDIKFSLSEKVERLKNECDRLRNNEQLNAENFERQSELKVKRALEPFQYMKDEIDSLKCVLELRTDEVQQLRLNNMRQQKQLEELPVAQEKILSLLQKVENLEAIICIRGDNEKQLAEKQQMLMRRCDRESKANKRLSMNNDELVWRLSQSDFSLPSNITRSYSCSESSRDAATPSLAAKRHSSPPQVAAPTSGVVRRKKRSSESGEERVSSMRRSGTYEMLSQGDDVTDTAGGGDNASQGRTDQRSSVKQTNV